MRRIFLLAVILSVVCYSLHAQWSGTSLNGNTYRNGNVGIGTDNPIKLLDVQNANTGAGESYIWIKKSISSTAAEREAGLLIGTNAGDFGNTFKIVAKSTNAYFSNPILNFDFVKPNGIGTTHILSINNTGNVGIGTTSPSYKLVVNGTISYLNGHLRNKSINTKPSSIDNIFDHASYDLIDLGGQAGSGNEITAIKLTTAIGETTFGSRLIQEDNFFRIQCGNGNSNPYSFLINGSTGNVGIGTNNPKAKLSVNGTIISNEIKVLADINQYPDFVFSDNYKLKSLKEIEKYIEDNNHLPDIPKAEEVQEGIALGEMNIKLLQKIEELTLYTIEQQKEIEELKALNEKLTNQNNRIEKLEEIIKELMHL